MFESSWATDEKVLNIFCTSTIKSRHVHMYDSYILASWSRNINSSLYDQYSIHIDCGPKVPSLIILKSSVIQEIIKSGWSSTLAEKAIQTSAMWYEQSMLKRKIWGYKTIAKGIWRSFIIDLLSRWKELDIVPTRTLYEIRNIENKSTKKIARIEVDVILKNERTELSIELIDKIIVGATKRLRKQLVSPIDFDKVKRVKKKPSYVWIRLHRKDGNLRELKKRTIEDMEMLSISEWISLYAKYRQPILVKKEDKILKRIRIKYGVCFE